MFHLKYITGEVAHLSFGSAIVILCKGNTLDGIKLDSHIYKFDQRIIKRMLGSKIKTAKFFQSKSNMHISTLLLLYLRIIFKQFTTRSSSPHSVSHH